MEASPPRRNRTQKGMTLIEITLVISVLLGLISILFLGASAYKKGSDRALCIRNIASVQKAVRSYSNLYAFGPSVSVSGLKDEIIGAGRFFESNPTCPANGTYAYGGDTIPAIGVAYLNCSIGDHVPASVSGW